MNITASVVLAFSAAFGINQSQVPVLHVPAPMPVVQTVEEYVREYYDDVPVLAEIASCESQFRQFDNNGNVIKNANSSAVGIMQIMSSIHDPVADKLGLDIYTIQGNLAYARYLYEESGTAPWNASKSCWGKSKNKIASSVAINK
jgi:soluble lytic murein transglycosylase-like protein